MKTRPGFETRVQKLLNQANNRVNPRFLFSEILFEIEPRGYTPLDMKFSVDSMAALRLLTGNRLYSDKRVFLRELVQNAVDACNLNKIFHQGCQPEISITFDPGYKTIRFRDNGIGMDRQWIEKYFLKVGISFYRSGDLKTIHKSRMDCHFISKFGIGFLSSFLAADRIVIRTRKKASQGLIITIHTLQDGIFVTQLDSLLPEGARQNIIGRINLTGKERCELSMDRNRIFWNENQFSNIRHALCLGIVDLANMVINSTEDSASPVEITPSLINRLAIFFNFNEINDEMYFRLNRALRIIVAKRFRDFIRINASHTRDNRHVPEADGYAERWQKEILAAFANRSRPLLTVN